MTPATAPSLGSTRKLWSALDGRRAEDAIRELLAEADIVIGGSRPHDVEVRDERLFQRVLRDGSLGFGEAFVDGWWDAPAVDETCTRIFLGNLDARVRESWTLLALAVRARLFNRQRAHAREVTEKHYDLGNDLYQAMLDPRMIYTCAYWNGAADLAAAQDAKLELVCKKIGIAPGMRILELGCGWGGFAAYAAERHGARVTAYNLSREQVAFARARCADLPVEIRQEDYRNATGTYDAVVSIGLFEHVGPKNYRGYMELASRCLARDGVAFIHTIAGNLTRAQIDPWFDRYIFPNAVFPTVANLGRALEGNRLVLEDLHNIGEHYDPTLMAWWKNFDAAWPTLRDKYGDRLYRIWKYYLQCSAAGFRARHLQLYQLVLSPQGRRQPPGARAA